MLQRLISTSSIASVIAAATSGLGDQLRRIAASPAPTTTRNGGRHRTVAQDKRRARKQRTTRRAKRLGHH